MSDNIKSPFDIPQQARFTAERDGAHIMITDRLGHVANKGTNPTTMLQFAIDNLLTPGRAWKELGVIKGDMGDVSGLLMRDYTHLKGINARMRLPTGGTAIIAQPPVDIYDVELEGLKLYSQTPKAGRGIYLYNFTGGFYRYAYNIDIHDCVVWDFNRGMETISYNTKFKNNRLFGNVQSINPIFGRDIWILGNTIDLGDPLGATDCLGHMLIDVDRIEVSGNTYRKSAGAIGATNWRAIMLEASCERLKIHHNTFGDVEGGGAIYVGEDTRAPLLIQDISIDHNHFNGAVPGAGGNGQGCVRFQGNTIATDVVIDNNISRDYADLFSVIAGANVRLKVSNNQLYNGNSGFRLYGATYGVELKDNSFYVLAGAPILGTGLLIPRGNIGFVTENRGFSTGTGAQQTIAHGCAFTPTYDQVLLSERSTGGALARQSAAPDVTNIYITATLNMTYNWGISWLP